MVKVTSSLEKWSWIAGIIGAVCACLSILLAVWNPFSSSVKIPTVPSTHSISFGRGAIIIQGNGNTVTTPPASSNAATTPPVTSAQRDEASRFYSINITDQTLALPSEPRHMVHYPQISGNIPHDMLARANHFLKRVALTEYERYKNREDVRISYDIGLKDFNLIGVNYEIFANNTMAAHPITSTDAVTLDIESGSGVTLKDLLSPNYIGEISKIIHAKLVELDQYYPCEKDVDKNTQEAVEMIEHVISEDTGHSANTCFNSITSDSQYYLTDTSIVFVFPKYSIAPGAEGDIEIPINFKEIQYLIKPDGALRRFL